VLGTWGAERLKAWPEVATLREQGFDVEFYIWSGVFAPAGLPAAKLAQVRAAVKASTQDAGFAGAMNTMNTPIQYLEGAEFEKFLDQDQKRLAVVIKAMGKLE
jgi:tripartite-type tricarboxylate transporter receptor subunit TctC